MKDLAELSDRVLLTEKRKWSVFLKKVLTMHLLIKGAYLWAWPFFLHMLGWHQLVISTGCCCWGWDGEASPLLKGRACHSFWDLPTASLTLSVFIQTWDSSWVEKRALACSWSTWNKNEGQNHVQDSQEISWKVTTTNSYKELRDVEPWWNEIAGTPSKKKKILKAEVNRLRFPENV